MLPESYTQVTLLVLDSVQLWPIGNKGMNLTVLVCCLWRALNSSCGRGETRFLSEHWKLDSLKNHCIYALWFRSGERDLGEGLQSLFLMCAHRTGRAKNASFLRAGFVRANSLPKNRHRGNRSTKKLNPHIIAGELKAEKFKKFSGKFWYKNPI